MAETVKYKKTMALNFIAPSPFVIPKHKHLFKLQSQTTSCKTFAQSQRIGAEGGGGVTEEDPPAASLSGKKKVALYIYIYIIV